MLLTVPYKDGETYPFNVLRAQGIILSSLPVTILILANPSEELEAYGWVGVGKQPLTENLKYVIFLKRISSSFS